MGNLGGEVARQLKIAENALKNLEFISKDAEINSHHEIKDILDSAKKTEAYKKEYTKMTEAVRSR